MNNDNVLEVNINKEIDCNKDVALWNYWDHEHLDIVHDGYHQSDILYDKKNFLFRVDKIKVPAIPFLKFTTPIFMVQDSSEVLIVYAIQMGIISKTTITIKSINKNKCKINMNYKFYLNGWRKILKPLLKKLIPRWNEKVWQEDFNVKLRRQKVLMMNFKDFVGLPDKKENRNNDSFKDLVLPIPRPINSSRDLHPLSVRYKKNHSKTD
jgi:hypothetical protein|tara:strand:+ start:254 stop:880 length:627 start_codon:yes stop_codon:yes gene_type:complete